MQLWESGLTGHEFEQLLPKAEKCFTKTDNKPKIAPRPTSINLDHLGGAFIVLGIGVCLAFLCFLIEQIAHFYHNQGRVHLDRRKNGTGRRSLSISQKTHSLKNNIHTISLNLTPY